MSQVQLYQSVLSKLSVLSQEELISVHDYLLKLRKRDQDLKNKAQSTMALAGGWSDLTDEEVTDMLEVGKKASESLFGNIKDDE